MGRLNIQDTSAVSCLEAVAFDGKGHCLSEVEVEWRQGAIDHQLEPSAHSWVEVEESLGLQQEMDPFPYSGHAQSQAFPSPSCFHVRSFARVGLHDPWNDCLGPALSPERVLEGGLFPSWVLEVPFRGNCRVWGGLFLGIFLPVDLVSADLAVASPDAVEGHVDRMVDLLTLTGQLATSVS